MGFSPSFSARFDTSVSTLPMVFCGIQYPENFDAGTEVRKIEKEFEAKHGPGFRDCASYTDLAGCRNTVLVVTLVAIE